MTGVRVSWANDVLVLALDRPARRNALSRTVVAALHDELTGSSISDAVAVVLTGDSATFSAGADLTELTGTRADAAFDVALAEVTTAIRRAPIPVLAAIEGPCIGAAADLALSCDVRVAGRGARIGIPAVRLGLLYRPESLRRLAGSLGDAAARRLLLLGGLLDAEHAQALGIVSDVVDDGQALPHALALLTDLPPGAGPALAATKALLADAAPPPGTADRFDPEYFALLDSPERHGLVTAARERHSSRPST